MTTARWQSGWLRLLLVAPLALVALAYAWLAVAHGTPWLWNVVVHEGGHYTLGTTILFMRHFLREIPVDVAMALVLAAAIRTVTPAPIPVRRTWFVGIAIVLMGAAFAVSAAQEGWWEALRDLLQYRTRDDDTRYGSHWRFHFLSTIWFAAAAPLLAGLTLGRPGPVRANPESRRLLMAAWGWVALLTLAFGIGVEPFTSARYIGHQAREILTHGLITLPLVFAVCVLVGKLQSPQEASGGHPAVQVSTWLAVVAIPVFLVIAFSGASLEGSAQLESGLSGVVAAHVFEHTLDYSLVMAITIAIIGRNHAARS